MSATLTTAADAASAAVGTRGALLVAWALVLGLAGSASAQQGQSPHVAADPGTVAPRAETPLALAPAPVGAPASAGTAPTDEAPTAGTTSAEAAPTGGSALPAGVRVLPTGGLDMEQAALLLSGQEGGLLPLAVFASPVGPAAGGGATVVVIEVAGASLLAPMTAPTTAASASDSATISPETASSAAPAGPLYVDVCLYVLSGDPPAVTVSVLETLAIDLDEQRDVLAGGGLQIVRRLALPAGAHSLRTLVRNRATRELGLRVTPLVVPALDQRGAALLGPFFAADAGPWLALARGDAPPAWLTGPPAALPLLAVETAASLQVVASSALAAGRFEVELQRDGKTVATLPTTVGARVPVADGVELLTLGFDPASAGAGVTVLLVRGDGAKTAPIRVVLTQGPRPSSWPAAFGGARTAGAGGDGGTASSSASPQRRPSRQSERQLARRYREALQELAGERSEAGSAAVTALESEALAGTEITPRELVDLERDVLAPLANAKPDALWPIVEHYLQSHRRHLAVRAGKLTTHDFQMVLALAALYAGAVEGEQRGLAATAPLALVSGLPPSGEHEVRTEALEAARQYRPTDVALLLCIAIDAERHAEYAATVETLAALRKLVPQDLEVRLRLGVNKARLGDRRQARAELGAAIETHGDPPPWWLPLAYQELGRLYLDSDDTAAAEKVLRQGLVRLPREEKLSLLLAQTLAARGERAQADEVLAAVAPSPADRGFDSARHRYIQIPDEPLMRAREEVAARAAAGRAALVAALAAPTRSGAAQ